MKCDNEQYIYFHTSSTSLSIYPVWPSINRPQIKSLWSPLGYSHKICRMERWRGQHSSSCFVSSLRYHFSIVDQPCVCTCWRFNCSPLLPRMLKICPQIFIVAASLETVTIFQSCIIHVHLRRWSPLISSCSVLVVLSFSSCWIIRVSPSLCSSRVSLLWKSIHVFRVVGSVAELLKDFTRGVAVYELCSCWLVS